MVDNDQFEWTRMTQRGVFTRSQAVACGVSQKAATRAIKRGEWLPVVGRGWVLEGQPVTIEQGAWAAKLTLPNAVIWGPSAVQLHRPKAPLPRTGVITVAVCGGATLNPQGILARHVALPESEQSWVLGLPVQKLLPALTDSLAWLAPEHAGAPFGWALARDLISPEPFAAVIASRAGRRGCRQLAQYAELAAAGAGSPPELVLQRVLQGRGITGWEPNRRLRLADGSLVRPDLLNEQVKGIIEVDGLAAHRTLSQLKRDRERQNQLILSGYKLLRFTPDDIANRPDHCADLVQQWTTQ
ncbi:MAG: type IV toxin-antitoxin system AbiEi family antitoxin domain-containing protein [Bifidobacteriaceae bacterium]|nr:type IV toxin-antitoxin system AbiEi family antitoxin domain-containing protein [Bifidobacteriaceae bacterium]